MPTFFGLSDEYIENVYEHMFQLKYHGGWSFFETYNLPISVRNWFLERLIRQKQEESDKVSNSSRTTAGRGKSYTP